MSPSVTPSMEIDDTLLSTPINPNNFPAKLWRLVNSPQFHSIRWDSRGEGVIIDQQHFESELLSPSKPLEESSELFKTTNFTSFIRQLNLYGFRKVVLGSGGSLGHLHPGGDLGVGDGPLHHFHNINFKKDHPELLVNLKRLTSANKAKLAAGLKVNSRPPNRFQRLLTNSLDSITQGKGAMSIGQLHRTFRRDNLSPYSYMSPPSHSQGSIHPMKGLDRTPIPSRTWQNSMGLLTGQMDAPPTFSDKGLPFPVLQRFPTEVTYTLQASPSVHGQQGSQGMVASGQRYSNYVAPPAPYHQAYYPTAMLQCCSPPTHMDSMPGCPNPNNSSYPAFNYYQNPSMQSSYPVEFVHSNWSCGTNDESKKTEVNLEAVFQIVDELRSSPKLQMVKVDMTESQNPMPQADSGNLVSSNPPSTNNVSAKTQTDQLESLTPVVSDITSFVVGSDQQLTCPLPQSTDFIYSVTTSQPLEEAAVNAAAVTAQPQLSSSEQAKILLENHELSQASSQSSVVIVEEGTPLISLKVDNNLVNQVVPSNQVHHSGQTTLIISELKSEAKPNRLPDSSETSLSTPEKPRDQRGSRQQGKSPDLHLLVDVACNQEHFHKEEEEGACDTF
ncbi:heat shock factor protein 5 [Latimeria chalumnae]|uniref:Heat shock factor protein 5 n=1 Tax=Latimeria chalumnae TaxID=7897 RepID=M3XLE0_LATCH|nr:PREDICTED: heat shock factor protein 5 isoform X1 [Latimeria chalumnae]|eukprot:XP_014341748.1 PREDICTED: heat shock factor protein 5 isoform X1 [Latimeria chalumnae]